MRKYNTGRFLADRFDVPCDETAICTGTDELFSLVVPAHAGELLGALVHLLLFPGA